MCRRPSNAWPAVGPTPASVGWAGACDVVDRAGVRRRLEVRFGDGSTGTGGIGQIPQPSCLFWAMPATGSGVNETFHYMMDAELIVDSPGRTFAATTESLPRFELSGGQDCQGISASGRIGGD